MESLLKQLRELPARFAALPGGVRLALIGGAAVAIALATAVGMNASNTGSYQYAFTNMAQEDSTEAAGLLKSANIPYRVDANGSALAVPADKVYDARIVLATAGLPRGGGVGFELFDRGDIGVSEFTQRVNLRRATEGELARTIGRLAGVKSARVTLSLAEKGLYREDDKKPSASVVVMLQPGRSLADRELAGIRHLTSSAVPGLAPDSVTVLDGRGAVLSGDSTWDSPEAAYQRKLERDYEQRIVTLLEPVVGAGSVIAKVSASVDTSTVNQNTEVFDPDSVVLRSEKKSTQSQANQTSQPQAVTGAAANIPLQPPAQQQQGPTASGNSSNQDEVRNYEISKTTTTTVAHLPRLQKVSVAVVVDGVDGKPRDAAEVARLGELVRKAVGFDESRGDQIEVTSQPFGHSADVPETKPEVPTQVIPTWAAIAIGVAVLAVIAFVATRKKKSESRTPDLILEPGANVAQLEAKAGVIDGTTAAAKQALPEDEAKPILIDPIAELREKARLLVKEDPERAALLVRSWLSADLEKPGVPDRA